MEIRRFAIVIVWAYGLVAMQGLRAQQPPAAPAEDPAALQKRIAALVAQLGGKDMKGQLAARNASRELAKIGKPAVPALLDAAKSLNPNVRWWALGSLASMGDPAAIETFLACLKDPNPTVRCVAVYQSRRFLSDERIRSALLAMPLQADTETRRALMQSFIESNFTPAIPVLKEGLKSTDPQARADFLETFTKLDKAGSLDALRSVLTADPDERVRASAVICLDNLLPPLGKTSASSVEPRGAAQSGSALLTAPSMSRGKVEGPPGKPPRRFLALLISALDDPSLKVQYVAVSRLCRLTGQKFVFSPDSSAEERAQAIKQWKDWWAKAAPTFPD